MKIIKKRVQASTDKAKPYDPIYCGISVDSTESVCFNWDKDSSTDVIRLASVASGSSSINGVSYFYAYSWENVDPKKIRIVRNYLKNLGNSDNLYSEDVEDFVELGVVNLGSAFELSNFDIIVSLDSTSHPSLVDIMGGYVAEYCNKPIYDFKLVKNVYRDVQLDDNKALQALLDSGYTLSRAKYEVKFLINKFDSLKQSGELFQMKRFLPRCIRSAFSNFLKFQNEEQKLLYSKLQGASVLVYDDFLTSGSTIKEILRYLKSINETNELSVFVLIQQ